MTAFQIVRGHPGTPGNETSSRGTPQDRGRVDLIIDGMNLTARIGEADRVQFLRDLCNAYVELARGHRTHVTVRCHTDGGGWELGLRAFGDEVLISLFRSGPHPEVAVFERRVSATALAQSTLATLAGLRREVGPRALRDELDQAEQRLTLARWPETTEKPMPQSVSVAPYVPREGTGQRGPSTPLAFGAEICLPKEEAPDSLDLESHLERADLFPLLVRGSFSVRSGEQARHIGQAFVFLVAEELLRLAEDALTAWEQGACFHRRLEVLGVLLGVRLDAPNPTASLFLTLGELRPAGSAPLAEPFTLKVADAAAFGTAVVRFGRALSRAILQHSPGERRNLRLVSFRAALVSLDDRLREARTNDSKINPAPESYRAFALPAVPTPQAQPHAPARLRFSVAWTATVPTIDLRATFLCGEALIVGAARETACLDRRTGQFLWRRSSSPAVSVVTPAGLARMSPDGTVALWDYRSGEIVQTLRVAPRKGGLVSGMVVQGAGLPNLLIVSEGDRHLSALDLDSGELRWRHRAQSGTTFRLRRAGRLLIVASSDPTLTAIDVTSGTVVWRLRDRLRFALQTGIDHDSLFALAGQADTRTRGKVRLYHLDPYAGTTRWACELPPGPMLFGPPMVASRTVALLWRDRRGVGLFALDRQNGEILWKKDPGILPHGSAWLSVDDALIANSESGEVLSICARTGSVLWRHRTGGAVHGDQPRRLEPILRSGALFVPQSRVHVLSPRDGSLLGDVPTDIIADLLRVDERCDVYAAEESGHICALRAGARLSLV